MVTIEIDFNRLVDLAKVFSDLGLSKVKLFEDIDPQYQAIKDAVSQCNIKYIDYVFYVNALNAYKLRMSGEDFWRKYADFIIEHCGYLLDDKQIIKLIIEFTKRFNSYAYEHKIKRLLKVEICSNLRSLVNSKKYLELAKETAKCLDTSIDAKTVVFAVKISYYVHKAQGIETIMPFELSIPVDRRIASISYTSGLIKVINGSTTNVVDLVLRRPSIVRYAWNMIAKLSNIPALHIDAVIWYFGKFSKVKNIVAVFSSIERSLYMHIGKERLEKLVKELFYIW